VQGCWHKGAAAELLFTAIRGGHLEIVKHLAETCAAEKGGKEILMRQEVSLVIARTGAGVVERHEVRGRCGSARSGGA